MLEPLFENKLKLSLLFFVLYSTAFCLRRSKLNALWNLEKMTECKLHCSAFTIYDDYGCWCGPGGSNEPVDEIDRCCMYHDKCYDDAVDRKYCWNVPEEYVDDYTWSCSANGIITCAEENMSDCQKHLCWCDKTVVECWGNYQIPKTKLSCSHEKTNQTTVLKGKQNSSNNKTEKDNDVWYGNVLNFMYSAWLFIPTALFDVNN